MSNQLELNIQHTPLFTKTLNAIEQGSRFVIHQGGSRSSKSYSILQILIYLCLTRPKTSVSIVRQSFPALRGSIMRDFIEIMNNLGLYTERNHNKTEHLYKFPNDSVVEFFSADSEQKLRGRKRDICFVNEANELTRDEFQQLSLRTTQHLILDFNPSDHTHWLYDLMQDERSIVFQSTYKDNTFLDPELRKEIENLINVDPEYYRIYALGERPGSSTRIYTHFQPFDTLPELNKNEKYDITYGLDFGFTHPSCLIKIYSFNNKFYVYENLYKSQLTAKDLISEVMPLLEKGAPIYCDWARPEIIEEMRRNHLNCKEANKEVKIGIDTVRSSEIYVHNEAINIWKEYKMYSWKSGATKEEPIKRLDEAMDAIRYAIHTHKKKTFNPALTRFY